MKTSLQKLTLMALVLTITIGLNAQMSYLGNFRYLLIGPASTSNLSPTVKAHYVTEYSNLKLLIEEELNSKSDQESRESLEKLIREIDIYIGLWSGSLKKDKLEKFASSYSDEKCYKLKTNQGVKFNGEFELTEPNKQAVDPIIITERINIKEIHSAQEWVKKKRTDYGPSHTGENDIVYCLESIDRGYKLWSGDESITVKTLPLNYEFNEEEEVLERKIEVKSSPMRLLDKDKGVELSLHSWSQIKCD